MGSEFTTLSSELINQRKAQYVRNTLAQIVLPMRPDDIDHNRRLGTCRSAAEMMDSAVDAFILANRLDLAQKYAELGLNLLRATGATAKRARRSLRPPNDLEAWARYVCEWSLRWHLENREEQSLLRLAFDAAERSFSIAHTIPLGKTNLYLPFAYLAGRVGEFSVAAENFRASGRIRKTLSSGQLLEKTGIESIGAGVCELLAEGSAWDALRGWIERFKKEYTVVDRWQNFTLREAAWMSYMASRDIEGPPFPEMTRRGRRGGD